MAKYNSSNLIILPNQKAIVENNQEDEIKISLDNSEINATVEVKLKAYNLSLVDLPFLPKKTTAINELTEGDCFINNKKVSLDRQMNIKENMFTPGTRVIQNKALAGFVRPNGSSVASVDDILEKFSINNKKDISLLQTGGTCCLKVGDPAPDFTADAVKDEEFCQITLSSYRGKWLVLFFYPLDFTFVCPTEITAFSDNQNRFAKLNTEILGVSVDSKYAHLRWCQMPRNEGGIGKINYPLVSDLKKEIATAYNVLNSDGEADRGLFIINPEGNIMHSTVNKAPVGRNVEETLRVLQAFQHVELNKGCVCPVNWTPGAKDMLEDPKGSQEYFSAL